MLLDAMRQCFEFCLALPEFFVAMVAGFYLLLRISQRPVRAAVCNGLFQRRQDSIHTRGFNLIYLAAPA